MELMRKIVIGALWTALAPAWALAQQDVTPQFLIQTDEGEVIGVQEARASESGLRITRKLRYSVDGHEPVRVVREIAIAHAAGFNELPANAPHWLIGLPTGAFEAQVQTGERKVALHGQSIPFPSLADPQRELYLATQDGVPVVMWLITRDEDGTIQRATLPGFGNSQHFVQASAAAIASARFGAAKVPHPMITVPYDITQQAREGHMRWRAKLPAEVAAMIPQTGQQAVIIEGEQVRIDICATCGPGLPSDAQSLAAATRATRWLNSDDAQLRAIAGNVRARSESEAATMAALARIARRRLSQVDFNGHLSARAAWDRRSGDCTEDAVLLAALARAAGVPAYVANGMVYSRERFHGTRDALLPHSWVVAFVDGEWRSFDMTLEEGFGATHIALTLGDGDARSIAASYFLAGLITWDSMAEVRPRPMEQPAD